VSAVDLISHKQAGVELSSDEIREMVMGYTTGEIPDYQMSAFLMAVYFRGMTKRETADLVHIMTRSGRTVDMSAIPGRKVDKHSTGGVGDKTSLVVAPLVAALGVPVPMMSGRGLGHTGGTLDKLESIPGFTVTLSPEETARQVQEIGCALIGQTDEIVPADRKMYALRDVTSTVKSNGLIAGSILSKKLAEGAQALLLDVKFGRGAIFSEVDEARNLARHLVDIGTEVGMEVIALLTDMDQPLGQAVGNWVEVRECVQLMRGETEAPDLKELCLVQAAFMLELGGKARDYQEGRQMAASGLNSGQAFDKFVQIARRQKADVRFLEKLELYPQAAASRVIEAPRGGYIVDLNALLIGQAAVKLGAGRLRQEDSVDCTAGIMLHHKRGDRVEKSQPLATIYASSEARLEAVLAVVSSAFSVADEPPLLRPLIISKITKNGEEMWPYFSLPQLHT
jgi:pyrimidine-nucleoside phosphorylase